jgi:hypothetical protein
MLNDIISHNAYYVNIENTATGLEAFANRPDRGVDPAQVIERPLEPQARQLTLALGLGLRARAVTGLVDLCVTPRRGSACPRRSPRWLHDA